VVAVVAGRVVAVLAHEDVDRRAGSGTAPDRELALGGVGVRPPEGVVVQAITVVVSHADLRTCPRRGQLAGLQILPEELVLAPGNSAHNADLSAAEARVPKQVTPAQAGLAARRVNAGSKPQVTVDLAAPPGQPVELFVEGPTPNWALPIPKSAKSGADGRAKFSFDLDGMPPGFDPKSQVDLTYTVVTGDRAVEVKSRLD